MAKYRLVMSDSATPCIGLEWLDAL